MNPFIYYTMCSRAKILFYCKLPRIGIYSIQLTPRIMSEPFRIWFTHVRNNLFTGIGKTLHCMPDSAYRHSVELHRMVQNGYSVSIRWVVKTVQCSLPMWMESSGFHSGLHQNPVDFSGLSPVESTGFHWNPWGWGKYCCNSSLPLWRSYTDCWELRLWRPLPTTRRQTDRRNRWPTPGFFPFHSS